MLDLAAEAARERAEPTIFVAGGTGPTARAVAEAERAVARGNHAGLLRALASANDAALLAHGAAVAEVIPVFGFYLPPAVGGRRLSHTFWREFVEIDNVVAIKVGPVNRYQTLDVVRAVAESGRAADVALYSGNDDHIFQGLLEVYRFPPEAGLRWTPLSRQLDGRL